MIDWSEFDRGGFQSRRSPIADQVDDVAHAVNSSASEYELLHVTIKLHRITHLDEMIGQFKD